MADTTHVGIIGLGKMGRNMCERTRAKGLAVTGYDPNPEVSYVEDSGEGWWTVREVLNQAVAALRNQFGGHSVRKS